MRFDGTLTQWNDERGFGFVEAAQGGERLFVHISAFAHDGQRPRVGELLSFEVHTLPDGKKRAVRVMRPAQAGAAPIVDRGRSPPDAHRARRRPTTARTGGMARAGIWLLILALLGAAGYDALVNGPAFRVSRAAEAPDAADDEPAPTEAIPRRCDGRTHCSQMTSCAEATWFLQNCADTKMDGDHDGVACEMQWCSR